MNPLADSSPPVPPRSLSSLSPSAPPFSVDRPVFPTHPYSPLYDCSPWPSLPGWDFGGEKFAGDFDVDIEFDGGESLSWMDPVAARHFSSFDSGISAENFMVPENSTSTNWGKDPASSTTLCGGLESSALFNENNSWACTRNSMLPLYKHENSFSNQSELRQSHFDLQDKSSTLGTRKTDTLTGQLTSHSTDALIFNPSAVLSTQQQLNAMPYGSVSSPRCGGIKCDHSQYINPYKIHNYFDYTATEKTDSIPTEKEQDCTRTKNNATIDEASFYSSTAIAGSSIHSDTIKWNAMEQSSDLKFESRILGMRLPSSSVSSYFSNPMDISFQTHSNTLDQQNAVVDSPCWKGSVPSNQFGICNDANHVSILNDLQSCNLGDQEKKSTAVSFESLGSSMFHDKQNSPFKETPPLTVGPELHANSEKVEIESSVKTEFRTAQNCGSLNMIKEQDTGARRKPCGVFGLNNYDMRCLNNEKNASQVDETATNGVFNLHLDSAVTAEDNLCDSTFDSSCARDHAMGTSTHEVDTHPNNSKLSGPFSFSSESTGGEVQLLFKAIHGLTAVLASNVHGVANKLKEHDIKLLYGVIDNLKEYVYSEKKGSFSKNEHQEEGFAKKSCHDFGVEASFFQGESKMTTGMTENVHGVDLNFINNPKPDDFATRDIGANYRRCMAQAVEDISKEKFFEPIDDPQALLYKNLWIEAEVSLCRLKYELQFARMKLDMECNKHHEVILEGDHDQKSSRLGTLNGTRDAECNKLKVHEFHKGIADDIASSSAGSYVDKFNVLKGKFVNPNSDILEEHMKYHEFLHNESLSERENQKVNSDEPSDIYQKKILQLPLLHGGRVHIDAQDVYNKPIFTDCKLNKIEVNELNSDKKVGFDASVMARLQILKGRADNLCSETVEGHQRFEKPINAKCLADSVNQQPCIDGELANQKSAVELKSSFKCLGSEHLGETVQPLNFLGSANQVEYMGYEEAKPGGTSNSASGSVLSEWEHIM